MLFISGETLLNIYNFYVKEKKYENIFVKNEQKNTKFAEIMQYMNKRTETK